MARGRRQQRAEPRVLKLLAIKLDDKLFVDRAVDIVASRQTADADSHLCPILRNPGGPAAPGRSLPGPFDMGVLATCVLDADCFTSADLVRRDIYFSLVHQDVSVIDKLTSLSPRGRETSAIDGIIQTALEEEQQVLTRDPLHARCPLEIITELSFEDEIDALDLLLFAKLLAVTDQCLAAPHRVTVLSGRLRAALLDRTGRLVTAITL